MYQWVVSAGHAVTLEKPFDIRNMVALYSLPNKIEYIYLMRPSYLEHTLAFLKGNLREFRDRRMFRAII